MMTTMHDRQIMITEARLVLYQMSQNRIHMNCQVFLQKSKYMQSTWNHINFVYQRKHVSSFIETPS